MKLITDPVKKFWGNIECALDEKAFEYIVSDMIKGVRKTLKQSSTTAQAIDRSEAIPKIATSARKEGLEEFADALDFATSD
ncbi:MAG: hypothetical protein G3M78_13340 [Candidatus Nitrohelix vancouverensis]|uniref:Uncharacterized protein n=1 Tax=Candidatus Nitrohelix vancouverensis TaxID=2705534 RepID=A0A7T0C4I1_9BACT|nr:MAG: hypothetical protein G3M78_13340 [Candidatus Nitrohelix vancouverensis]